MSGTDTFDDLLGPDPDAENLVDEAPVSRPMGAESRALLERSRTYPVNRAATKNTPKMLKRLLSYAAEMPLGTTVARRAGISYTTLRYWLQKSKEGAPGDGFDCELSAADENESGDTLRFHLAWDSAMEVGVGLVEQATIRRAMGYEEVLTYQGRVQYKYDPVKVADSAALGLPEEVPQNYLLDEFGAPVPETVWKMDPDLAMFILKTHKPERYGNKATMDVNVRGGVLVVPMRAIAAADLNVIEEQDRKRGRSVITFDEGNDGADDV